MVDRAAQLSRELGFDLCIIASGEEWRRPDLVKATGAAFIVPVNFPSLPKLPDEDDWTQVSLDRLRAWDWAPENPALLREQGLEVALTTYGLSDKKKFSEERAPGTGPRVVGGRRAGGVDNRAGEVVRRGKSVGDD